MTYRNLVEVRTRLEDAVAALPIEPSDSAQLEYDRYLMVAVEMLDSAQSLGLSEKLAEKYLETYLYCKFLELGLHPDYPASE